MTVSPEIGRYKCWSCGEGGDIFTWVMKTQKVEFPEAMRLLAAEAGVQLSRRDPVEASDRPRQLDLMKAAQNFFVQQLGREATAKEYCEKRGLDADLISRWGIGYGPDNGEALVAFLKKQGASLAEAKELFLVENDGRGGFFDRFRSRLTFPICDERGAVVAFGGRIIGSGQPKYINSSDTPLYHKSRLLYGLHLAKEHINAAGYAVIVEGYMDVLSCHAAGVNQAVATLGTALTEDHLKILKRWCRKIVLLYDQDNAGQAAAEKATALLLSADFEVKIAMPPSGEDPDSLRVKQGSHAVQALIDDAVSPVEHQVGRLKLRSDPNTTEFWEEAAAILALAPNPLELERQLEPLAMIYPGAPDKNAARTALRRMTALARRRSARRPESLPAAPTEGPRLPIFQRGLEGVVLRCLLQDDLKQEAWSAVKAGDLFRPGLADITCAALRLAYPDAIPDESPSVWINRLTNEEAKQLLLDLSLLEGRSRSELVEAIERLKEKKQGREREAMTPKAISDDQELSKISELLQKKHRGESA